MHSLRTYDKVTEIDVEGVSCLHFLTEQCTFIKQEQDEGCHCYTIGWSTEPIVPKEFRKNVCESCSGEYLKNSPPDTFQVKGRGPLKSLGHHNTCAENIKIMNDAGGSANIVGYDIANLESSFVDFSRFPATLKNDFFVRTNDTISCNEGNGSACYFSRVYWQDLLKPADQPCNFGGIRITVEAYVPKSLAILGKATRNEGGTISIVPYKFRFNGISYDFLWYSADSKLSVIDQVDAWYHSRDFSHQSEKDEVKEKSEEEVNEEDKIANDHTYSWKHVLLALSSLAIAVHNEFRVKKMVDKFGNEFIPNEYTILRFIKWALAILSCTLILGLFHVVSDDLELYLHLFPTIGILLQCRDKCLEGKGYREEDGTAYFPVQTDGNDSIALNPQEPNLDMNIPGIRKRQIIRAKSS